MSAARTGVNAVAIRSDPSKAPATDFVVMTCPPPSAGFDFRHRN
jgi:hypothetical protein